MEKLFVPYTLALLAKERGYKNNNYCLGHYYKSRYSEDVQGKDIFYIDTNQNMAQWESLKDPLEAILWQQLIDWLREKGIVVSIYNNASGYLWNMSKTDGGTDLGWSEFSGTNNSGVWDDYYVALTEALTKALQLT
jgi:hypothetical protein